MKQHITPSQANEVSFQDFCIIYQSELVYREDWSVYHAKKMTIGKLLEYMLEKNNKADLIVNWFNNRYKMFKNIPRTEEFISELFYEQNKKELIDFLWEETKNIVRKENNQ